MADQGSPASGPVEVGERADASLKTIHCVHLLNDYSGSPRVLKQAIVALQEQGHRCRLYRGSEGRGVLDDLDTPTYTFTYRRSDNRWLTLLAYGWSQMVLFCLLLRHLQRGSVVLINTMLPFAAALAGKIKGAHVVYHVHETSLRPRLLKACLRWVIGRCADKVIYVSRYLQDAEKIEGISALTVHNALAEDFQAVASASEYQSRHDGKFNVLMLASLKAYKGVDEFVGLATAMADDDSLHFHLVLNASGKEIQDYFAGKPMPANLHLHPVTASVTAFYRQSSLVLNLSHVDGWIETFGLTILEAMAFGIPTIVPPLGGPLELVEHGVEGYRIDSRDAEQLRRTVASLSQQPQLCQALSASARTKASGFSAGHFKDQIVRVFDDL